MLARGNEASGVSGHEPVPHSIHIGRKIQLMISESGGSQGAGCSVGGLAGKRSLYDCLRRAVVSKGVGDGLFSN